jgi:hypothetical protein
MNRSLIALALAVCPALAAHAVEGGVGRSITGLQVSDYAGVVPPEPGWTLAAGYVYYSGTIGADREVPIIGATALGLEATFGLSSLTGVYAWNTGPGRWNFASMAALPYASVDITAGLALGSIRRSVSDSTGNPYDLSFAPIIAGYHFDKTRHLALALYVSAPTGRYDPTRLANPSLNVWVYSPTVSYTQLFQSGTLEWSTAVGVDFSTKNDDTDYKSGAVFHADTLLVKNFANGWGRRRHRRLDRAGLRRHGAARRPPRRFPGPFARAGAHRHLPAEVGRTHRRVFRALAEGVRRRAAHGRRSDHADRIDFVLRRYAFAAITSSLRS